jgi:nitrite reductase/ring-hydroxylating ferredoxin subunit
MDEGPPNTNEVPVCALDELVAVGRKLVEAPDGREVCVVHHKGNLYAFDRRCYHVGYPMDQGDIEELGGRMCINCPLHNRVFDMETGEMLAIVTNRTAECPEPAQLEEVVESAGVRQRMHEVVVRDGLVHFCDNINDGRKIVGDNYNRPKRKLRDRTEKAIAGNQEGKGGSDPPPLSCPK